MEDSRTTDVKEERAPHIGGLPRFLMLGAASVSPIALLFGIYWLGTWLGLMLPQGYIDSSRAPWFPDSSMAAFMCSFAMAVFANLKLRGANHRLDFYNYFFAAVFLLSALFFMTSLPQMVQM